MKRISYLITCSVSLWMTVSSLLAQPGGGGPGSEESESPTEHNHIVVYAPQQPGLTEGTIVNTTVEQVNKSYQYFDGLGRLIQTVSFQGSPGKQDVVQPTVYDEFGRESEKFLPYVSDGNNGWFKVDPVGKQSENHEESPQGRFYDPLSPTPKVEGDDVPFAVTIFEPSPLNRMLKQGGPGVAWQPHVDPLQDRSVKMAYQFNGAEDVIKLNYNVETDQLSVSSHGVYYAPNELYANVTNDEHNNEVIEYVDKIGRTLCKKVQHSTVGPTKLYAETYYVYDDFGNIVLVLQPEGVEQLKNTLSQD